MSDPAPEDLYDALRKRLANYGQEPPPGLWAGIRQQLPPPVAVPRRRRRRAGVLLLGLLCLVAALGTWQWQRVGHRGAQTGAIAQQAATPGNAGHGLEGRNAQAAATVGPDSKAAVAASSEAVASQRPNAGPATASQQASSHYDELNTREISASQPLAEIEKARGAALAQNAKSVSPLAVASATSGPAGRRQRARVAAGVASSASVARRGRLLRSTREVDLRQGMATAMRPGSEPAVGLTRTGPPTVAGKPQAAAVTVAAGEPVAAGRPTTSASPGDDAGRAGQADQLLRTGAASEATNPAALPGAASGAQAQWDWLNARLVGLQMPAATVRAPQPVAVVAVPPVPPPAVVARWAVQLVAGPGLTYRHLGTSSLSYAAPPSTTAPVFSGGNIVRTPAIASDSVAALERPALGYGAQLSLRRALTPRWTVSAGLGYAEYATGRTLRPGTGYNLALLDSLSRAGGSPRYQRDTYRFLTVPLRAGYAWAPAPRWQVGLLGGFEAAIYLGGTSTEGSACACQPQSWGASGSPYRSLSLAASLGAEVRYRLAGPWQLLAQPTASYLLTPLARPVSGYAVRHLLGGTALLGVAYDLP